MKLLLALSFIWLLSELILIFRKRASHTSKKLDKSSFKLLWVVIFMSINLGIFFGMSDIGRIHGYREEIYITGIILLCLGMGFRWISIVQLKQYFTVDVAISEDHQLIQKGLYRRVRHPAYAGGLLSFLGLGLALDNWLSLLIIFLPIFITFLYRIAVEEAALQSSFGPQYQAYRKKTKKLIPGLF